MQDSAVQTSNADGSGNVFENKAPLPSPVAAAYALVSRAITADAVVDSAGNGSSEQSTATNSVGSPRASSSTSSISAVQKPSSSGQQAMDAAATSLDRHSKGALDGATTEDKASPGGSGSGAVGDGGKLRAVRKENTRLAKDLFNAENAIVHLKDTITLLEASLHMAQMVGKNANAPAGSDPAAHANDAEDDTPGFSRADSSQRQSAGDVSPSSYSSAEDRHRGAEVVDDSEDESVSSIESQHIPERFTTADATQAKTTSETMPATVSGHKRARSGKSSRKRKKSRRRGDPKAAGSNFSSGYRGVYLRGGKWNAQIQYAGRKLYLGTFSTELDAARAYDAAAVEHHGFKALTNFDGHGNVLVQNLVNRAGAREHASTNDAYHQAPDATAVSAPAATTATSAHADVEAGPASAPPATLAPAPAPALAPAPASPPTSEHTSGTASTQLRHHYYQFMPHFDAVKMGAGDTPHMSPSSQQQRSVGGGAPDMAHLPNAIGGSVEPGQYVSSPPMPSPFFPMFYFPPSAGTNAATAGGFALPFTPADLHRMQWYAPPHAGSAVAMDRSSVMDVDGGGHSFMDHPRGKLDSLEKSKLDEFIHKVKTRQVMVVRGELAKELREFVAPKRSQEFFEKLISRRHLNKVLADFLVVRSSQHPKPPTASNVAGAPGHFKGASSGIGSPAAMAGHGNTPQHMLHRGLPGHMNFQPITPHTAAGMMEGGDMLGSVASVNALNRPHGFLYSHGQFRPFVGHSALPATSSGATPAAAWSNPSVDVSLGDSAGGSSEGVKQSRLSSTTDLLFRHAQSLSAVPQEAAGADAMDAFALEEWSRRDGFM